MKLIRKKEEGKETPQGLSYRWFDGKSILSGALGFRIKRFMLSVGFHRYTRGNKDGNTYTFEFNLYWL